MDPFWKSAVRHQFGAAIDMLENAVRACPGELWDHSGRGPEFWYLTYHTLFFLDFYLSPGDRGFAPPEPFTLGEMDPSGVMPDRTYTKDELLRYLQHGRAKCGAVIDALTDASAAEGQRFGGRERSAFEWLIYNLRHVQHHAAQLNLLLRHSTDSAPRWVGG
jgi:hypothetical protein